MQIIFRFLADFFYFYDLPFRFFRNFGVPSSSLALSSPVSIGTHHVPAKLMEDSSQRKKISSIDSVVCHCAI